MAAIRDLYAADPEPCDRETLLGLLRDELGLGALGTRIRKELSGDIRAAVRRGILDRTAGLYALLCQHIGQYDPNFLREQFLASLGSRDRNPHAWNDREEAIRETARFLGFRRTGQTIQKAFRSAINSAIRRGELESDGSAIRRAR